MISDLTPVTSATVNGGEQSAASRDTSRLKAGCSNIYPARAGDVHSAHTSKSKRNPGEPDVITAARPVVIKEIFALLGNDMPDSRAHRKYLERLNIVALCARRDQLLAEKLHNNQKELGI